MSVCEKMIREAISAQKADVGVIQEMRGTNFKLNKETVTIATYIVCGMALCKEHLVQADIDMWEGGYPMPYQKTTRKMPRILCNECYSAVK